MSKSNTSSNQIVRQGYKILAIVLLGYALIQGLMATLPELDILQQSSRVIFYHVPMWMVVVVMMGISVWQSVYFLRISDPEATFTGNRLEVDAKGREAAYVGTVFIVLGLITGTLWGRVAWKSHIPDTDISAWWTNDPILVCALISLLIYLAYFLLRSSFSEPDRRARVAAVYNIFAFATLIPLYFIIPKMLPGLHPTADGSEAGGGSFVFLSGGIDNRYRMVLYPAMLGFILLGIWIYELRNRLARMEILLEDYKAEEEYESRRTVV